MSKLAVLGGDPEVDGPIGEPWPQHDQSEREALLEVLESGQWGMGPKVKEFEEAYAEFQSARFGVACTGGTVALEAACRGAEIGIGDEVITTPYTYHGTCLGIMNAGATCTFADIDPETNNIDPDEIENAITPRTKGIMVVHFGGLPCDMKRIQKIADRHGLVVMEDACHGWGSRHDGRGLGSHGLAGGFSFQMSKNMTSGEGGIALTSDESVAHRMSCVVTAASQLTEKAPEHLRWGGNHRMSAFSAAMLLCQMKRIERHTDIREQNAAMLTRSLSGIDGFEPIRRLSESDRVSWHIFSARVIPLEWDGVSRAQVVKALSAEGVPVSTGYQEPVYRNTVFQTDWDEIDYKPLAWTASPDKPNYRDLHLPKVEQYCKDVLWIGQRALLAPEDKMRAVTRAFEKVRENREQLRDISNSR